MTYEQTLEVFIKETNEHKLTVDFIAAGNGNDCDAEIITCSCGKVNSFAQEGGGVWQYNKDKQIGHDLDQIHSTLYHQTDARGKEWKTEY